MHKRLLPAALAAAVSLSALSAGAAALKVSPLTINLVPPAETQSISLQNTGTTPLSVQVRVQEWTQVDGENRYAPTNDVVASPPASQIPPGQTYTVRVARVAKAPIKGEKSYRLWIDELPPALPPNSEASQVAVRLRYDLPVFFHEKDTGPKLAWKTRRAGGNLVVEATNSGAGHARIDNLKVSAGASEIAFGSGLNGYVLPGATMRWTAPAGAAAGGQAAVSAGVGGNAIREVVPLAAN